MKLRFVIGLIQVLSLVAVTNARAESPEATCSMAAGKRTHTLEIGGMTRQYHVDVGPTAMTLSAGAPLVFLWHGFGGRGSSIAPVLKPARVWRSAIVVAPEGLPRRFPGFLPPARPGWQIAKGEHGDRDLAFFDAILSHVSDRYCVDPKRIYSTGFSNGGYFTNLLGCWRANVLAAIAPMSGGGPRPSVRGKAQVSAAVATTSGCGAPLPVRVTHGMRDQTVPFSQGFESYYVWSQHDGECAEVVEPTRSGCTLATGCAKEVGLCAFSGPHTWPASMTAGLVEFFQRHTRP